MRYFLNLFIALGLATPLVAQTTVKMSAVQATDYGVTYSLPKTAVVMTVKYTKTTKEAGDFYAYAERYLNINNPITKNSEEYKLDKISASTKGVLDKEKSYVVEFKAKGTTSFVTLTKDGMICAINADYEFPEEKAETATMVEQKRIIDPNTYLSEEILRAGSTAKQAELIAKQIYRLRESKTNILTGEADNMPPDGDSYKLVMRQLEDQEKALTELFVGKVYTEKMEEKIEVVPSKEDLVDDIAFRFSKKLGVVDKENLAGAPIYLSLVNKDPQEEVILTDKEIRDLDKKFSQGIIYNVPNKASLKVKFKGETFVDTVCDVVQFGSQEVLTSKMFENNKQAVQVIFYPDLGAVKQIIQ